MSSLAAVSKLHGIEGFVASIGFGIDAFHGVCHSLVLENIASLTRKGGYLGAFSVTPDSAEGRAYLDAVDRAQQQTSLLPSIVNGSIAAAIEGQFGDVRLSKRTAPGDLFINPLMGIYFTFNLQTVARQSLYLDRLEGHRDDTRGRRAHRDIRAARGCATLGNLSTLSYSALNAFSFACGRFSDLPFFEQAGPEIADLRHAVGHGAERERLGIHAPRSISSHVQGAETGAPGLARTV